MHSHEPGVAVHVAEGQDNILAILEENLEFRCAGLDAFNIKRVANVRLFMFFKYDDGRASLVAESEGNIVCLCLRILGTNSGNPVVVSVRRECIPRKFHFYLLKLKVSVLYNIS